MNIAGSAPEEIIFFLGGWLLYSENGKLIWERGRNNYHNSSIMTVTSVRGQNKVNFTFWKKLICTLKIMNIKWVLTCYSEGDKHGRQTPISLWYDTSILSFVRMSFLFMKDLKRKGAQILHVYQISLNMISDSLRAQKEVETEIEISSINFLLKV